MMAGPDLKKTRKDNEAKMIAKCFNAITNTLTDQDRTAKEVMSRIHTLTEQTVKLFASKEGRVKYGTEEGEEATADELQLIEGAIGHGILRGYLNGDRLDVSKVQKSKFYKDVQTAITAAGKSLHTSGVVGNLLKAQEQAMEKIKKKASNAAEFLATLFLIVEEHHDKKPEEVLSVIVGLITDLQNPTPIVVAKGRTGHKSVLTDTTVKKAAEDLKENWGT